MKRWWFNSTVFKKELKRRYGIKKSMHNLFPIEKTSESDYPNRKGRAKNIHSWGGHDNSTYSNVISSDEAFLVRVLVRDRNGDGLSIYLDIENQIFEIEDHHSFLSELESSFLNYCYFRYMNSGSTSEDSFNSNYDRKSSWNNHITSCIDSYLQYQIGIDTSIVSDSSESSTSECLFEKGRTSSESEGSSIQNDEKSGDFTLTEMSNDDATKLSRNRNYSHLWVLCENEDCYRLNYKKSFFSKLNICEFCGYHLKMTSSERLEFLIDPGTWDPMDEDMISLDPIEFDPEEEQDHSDSEEEQDHSDSEEEQDHSDSEEEQDHSDSEEEQDSDYHVLTLKQNQNNVKNNIVYNEQNNSFYNQYNSLYNQEYNSFYNQYNSLYNQEGFQYNSLYNQEYNSFYNQYNSLYNQEGFLDNSLYNQEGFHDNSLYNQEGFHNNSLYNQEDFHKIRQEEFRKNNILYNQQDFHKIRQEEFRKNNILYNQQDFHKIRQEEFLQNYPSDQETLVSDQKQQGKYKYHINESHNQKEVYREEVPKSYILYNPFHNLCHSQSHDQVRQEEFLQNYPSDQETLVSDQKQQGKYKYHIKQYHFNFFLNLNLNLNFFHTQGGGYNEEVPKNYPSAKDALCSNHEKSQYGLLWDQKERYEVPKNYPSAKDAVCSNHEKSQYGLLWDQKERYEVPKNYPSAKDAVCSNHEKSQYGLLWDQKTSNHAVSSNHEKSQYGLLCEQKTSNHTVPSDRESLPLDEGSAILCQPDIPCFARNSAARIGGSNIVDRNSNESDIYGNRDSGALGRTWERRSTFFNSNSDGQISGSDKNLDRNSEGSDIFCNRDSYKLCRRWDFQRIFGKSINSDRESLPFDDGIINSAILCQPGSTLCDTNSHVEVSGQGTQWYSKSARLASRYNDADHLESAYQWNRKYAGLGLDRRCEIEKIIRSGVDWDSPSDLLGSSCDISSDPETRHSGIRYDPKSDRVVSGLDQRFKLPLNKITENHHAYHNDDHAYHNDIVNDIVNLIHNFPIPENHHGYPCLMNLIHMNLMNKIHMNHDLYQNYLAIVDSDQDHLVDSDQDILDSDQDILDSDQDILDQDQDILDSDQDILDSDQDKNQEYLDSYLDRLDSYQDKTGLTEAVQTGVGQINGIPIALAVMDFQFIGGSMGSVVGEKITRLIEYATNQFLPLIIVCASGGARMQEGSLSLMQMAKISSALYDYQSNKKSLYVSILTSPTTGGVTASFGMLGDIIIAEPNSYIAFAGKRVIEQTLNITVPEGSQEAEPLFEKGLFDLIVPRNLLKSVLVELFKFHGFFPLNSNSIK